MSIHDIDYAVDELSAENINTILDVLQRFNLDDVKEVLMSKLDEKLREELDSEFYGAGDFIDEVVEYFDSLKVGVCKKKFKSALLRNACRVLCPSISVDEMDYPKVKK